MPGGPFRSTFLPILLAFALAGCFSTPQPAASGPSDPTGSPAPRQPLFAEPPRVGNHTLIPVDLHPEMVGCNIYGTSFLVPEDDIKPYLPGGYRPIGPTTNRLPEVGVGAFQCEAIVLDNQTVVEKPAFILVLAFVAVNQTLQGSIPYHAYAFEFLTTDVTLRDLVRAHGLPAVLADISFGPLVNGHRVTVSVEGRQWYQFDHNLAKPERGPRDLKIRDHFVPEGGPPVWIDYEYSEEGEGDVFATTLTASDGFLKKLTPANSLGRLVGAGST
ncbi:MAG: hypothetical protein ACREA0_12860, partial [bacterium]